MATAVDAPLLMLADMGFDRALAQKALLKARGDVQVATDLLLLGAPLSEAEPSGPSSPRAGPSHTHDPVGRPGRAGQSLASTDHSEESLSTLLEMGFEKSTAVEALRRVGGNVDAALASLLDAPPPSQGSSQGPLVTTTAVVEIDVESNAEDPAPSRSRPSSRRATDDTTSGAPTPRKRRRSSGKSPKGDSALAADSEANSSKQVDEEASKEHSVDVLSARLAFGSAAFGPLRRKMEPTLGGGSKTLKPKELAKMLEASVPNVKNMRGERDKKTVTQMLTDCYGHGLFMHGPPDSAVNRQVVPALQHVFAEMAKLQPTNPKRVSCLTTLAEACMDCQQVQAREILRMFSDLTAQNETFPGQLKYSLLREKEAALNRLITTWHSKCDRDHTKVNPWQQRAHLVSGYVSIVGDAFGLDGITAAQSDRFLHQSLGEIGHVSVEDLMKRLCKDMSVKEWLQTLLADINNQSAETDRLINRDCIFSWVKANMSEDAAYRVFYDEDRAGEFEGQDPEKPTAENSYQPFLSCKVLVEMLLKMGMLEDAPVVPTRAIEPTNSHGVRPGRVSKALAGIGKAFRGTAWKDS